MAPKKKAGGKDDEEDTSTRDLLYIYRKNCKELEIPSCKMFESKINEILEEDGHLPEILINEKIGELGMRALATALMKTNKQKGYRHLQSIRIWDGEIGDEGTRAISQYITDTYNSSVTIVELLNCGMGPLGCEFISRMFEGSLPSNITILTLDYNNFGNEGLSNLMRYIETNKLLKYLSLAYCGIDEKGVTTMDKFLRETTTLETLILQGNPLKNPGMLDLISILYNNSSIEEINLNNVHFGNDPDGVISNFANFMATNQTLIVYHIKFNFITDQDFEVIFKSLKENCPHIVILTIDEKIRKDLFDDYFKLMKGRKRKPKKKAGKAKGKGKGK